MWKTILDLLMPINCLGCGQEGQFICPACFRQIPLNKESPLKSEFSQLAALLVASDYDHSLVKQAIHRYKYDFVKDLAEPLGQLMVKKLTQTPVVSKKDSFLIPVPLHPKRLRWRGFNQAELLAQKISQELKIPLVNHVLIRQKYHLPQMAIKSSQERKANIKEAFALNPVRSHPLRTTPLAKGKDSIRKAPALKVSLKNKTIILVDDICTSGATLEECARVLKPVQAKEIWGLVIARG